MEYNETIRTILSRSSYRGVFRNTPVPRTDLETILKAGFSAPSGCNRQTPVFVGVDSPEKMEAVKLLFPRKSIESAQAFILVFTQKIEGIDGRFYNVEDYAASIENMLIAIKSLGYETCWYQGGVRACGDDFRILFNMPSHFEFICLLPIGIPAEPVVPNTDKQPFESRVWFNEYNGKQ